MIKNHRDVGVKMVIHCCNKEEGEELDLVRFACFKNMMIFLETISERISVGAGFYGVDCFWVPRQAKNHILLNFY